MQKAKMMRERLRANEANGEWGIENGESDRRRHLFRIPHSSFRVWDLWWMIFAFVAIILVVGCAAPDPQPLLLGEPVWQSGERSTYRVTNREGNVVGTAQVEITADNDFVAGEGWTFQRQIVDIGVSEAVTVEVQARGYLPTFSATTRTLAQGQQVIAATHNQAQIDIALTSAQGSTVYERVNAPSDVRDERTILPLLRTLPLRQGYATFINSFFPLTGFTERLAIRIVRSEQVTVPAGVYNAWLIEARTTDRTTRAWIATEAPYPLVKFVEGRSQGIFELTNFEPGNSLEE
ncbi:MAG: DUF3108 domain-containing protein [Caldilineaceae bacterium]|nr:DUF3108 domain-containing protein [Caldilineaceae bacterium]